MAFQSLYRRYRPQRFDEVVGQEHLVSVLRNAVVEDKVGHAYLLSGPRGTGKTSTARILAKALNCENLSDTGEPCGECGSCASIEAGNSMDLVELDAASNNRVENIRDLITNAALGSPGRRKVYLLDEVHMLSTAASNSLLKTLEEPPSHVVFVLATTDPQKVLPTIRSRTQHLELSLIGASDLQQHIRNVGQWAGAELTDEIVDYVVGRGGGSARDTLSALDQVLAAGGIPDDRVSVDQLVDALAQGTLGPALAAVADAADAGVDPRDLAERITRRLRDCFLVMADATPPSLPASDVQSLAELGQRLGRAMTVRALELIGTTLVDMRQAPDPRLTLEVAIVRLLQAEAQTDVAALAQRIERLEQGRPPAAPAADAATPSPGQSAPATPPAPVAAASEGDDRTTEARQPERPAPVPTGANAAREALAKLRGQHDAQSAGSAPAAAAIPPPPAAPGSTPSSTPPPPAAPAPPAPAAPATPPAPEPAQAPPPPDEPPSVEPPAVERPSAEPAAAEPVFAETVVASPPPEPEPVSPAPEPDAASAPAPPVGGEVSHGRVNEVWADRVLPRLGGIVKAMFSPAQFMGVDGDTAIFQVPNEKHRERCEPRVPEVEAVLAEEYGGPVRLRLVHGTEGIGGHDDPMPGAGPVAAAAAPVEEETVDLTELEDAPPDGRTSLDRITDAFPGATIVEDPDGMMGT